MDESVIRKIKSILELDPEASDLDLLEEIVLLKSRLRPPATRSLNELAKSGYIPDHLLRRAEKVRAEHGVG